MARSPNSGTSESAEPATGAAAPDRELVRLLTQALRQLGEAGQPDIASRLAGRAWSTARRTDPILARRINGLMHYLARLPDPIDARTNTSTAIPNQDHLEARNNGS